MHKGNTNSYKKSTVYPAARIQLLVTGVIVHRVCNGGGMASKGLRASSLSADTNADAGQNTSSNHLNPNALYMMLWANGYRSFGFMSL